MRGTTSGLIAVLLLCRILQAGSQNLISYLPRNGPASGGTVIDIVGEGFITTGNRRSKCNFQRMDGRGSAFSRFNQLHNTTHISCTMPDIQFFFSSSTPLPPEGTSVQLSITGVDGQSNPVNFLVYDLPSILITLISPNYDFTNSTNGTRIAVVGQGFVNTRETTCRLTSQNTSLVPAVFISSTRLECVLPVVRVSSRIGLTVSLNGQPIAAVSSPPGVQVMTFFSPAPRITSSHFSPSYTQVLLQFDREVEIGPEALSSLTAPEQSDDTADLQVSCSLVFGSAALQLLGDAASCVWQNAQQRVLVVRLTADSNIGDSTVLDINQTSIRTRHVLFSRQASGSVIITSLPGVHLTPLSVLESPQTIPMCGDFQLNGDNSLYGGTRGLEYAWTVGTELDELEMDILNPLMGEYVPTGFSTQSRIHIPVSLFYSNLTTDVGSGSGMSVSTSDSELLPLVTYYVQLVTRSYLGLSSTTVLHDITTTRSSVPPIVLLGERRRTVQPWRETLLEGKVLDVSDNCTMIESRIASYLWQVTGDQLGKGLQGVKTNTSVLILPPDTLLPGSVYRATITVIFLNQQSSSAYVELYTAEGVEARIEGGVRRSVGGNGSIDLDGTSSLVYISPATQLDVVWACSVVAVPELPTVNSSCENFVGSTNLSLSLPESSLMPGGYQFTLTLSFSQNENATTLIQSAATQLLVVMPHPFPPRIKILHSSDFMSFPVHRRLVIEAEITSLRPGSAVWSNQYVIGYGRLQLQPNITSTPLHYSICSSLQSCPLSETGSNLYISGLSTDPPQPSPLTNRISLVLQEGSLLPQNSYRFKMTVMDDQGQNGFAEVDVHTESVPNSGRVEISHERGYPLETVFSLRALDWTDERGDGPLKYRLGFRYDCANRSAGRCEEWMSGVTQDNQFFFTLPCIHSDLDPELVLRVSDRNGAVQHLTHDFDLLELDSPHLGEDSTDLLNLLNQINATIVSGYWVEGLAKLSSLIISADVDHETVICRDSLSSQFQLSNREFVNFKVKALEVILYLYNLIPASESHHEVIISLLHKVLKVCCDARPCFQVMDNSRLLNTLQAVVEAASRFEKSGVLSQRGISREVTEMILSSYRQLLHATTLIDQEAGLVPRANHTAIATSFTRILPEIGSTLCQRQSSFQASTMINLDTFISMKSSLINLPPDYVVGGYLDRNLPFEPVNVDFGSELFSRFLQYTCSVSSSERDEDNTRFCSGLCISSAQLYLNLFWSGSEFSSQVKTPILHLSLFHPSNGTPVATPLSSTSQPALTLPLVAEHSSSANLHCVVWEDSSLSWSSSLCDTVVMAGSSQVRCACSALGSLFYAVLERCPQGYYGVMCNQTCPQGLWGSECNMSCDCSDRGTCSAVNGSCDCDPGWEGANCQNACLEGSYGKRCGETCSCQNGATCDHVTGECVCTHGWIGNFCSISCDEGFYGDQCASRCQCRNSSECDFVTGSCTCQAGFTGLTCHDACPDGSYGLGCSLSCECFTRGTMSCDPIDGTCDCNDMWMGELCEVPPPVPTAAPFQAWWAVAGVLAAVATVGAVALCLALVVAWKKKKRKTKVLPAVTKDAIFKVADDDTSSSSSNSTDSLPMSKTKSEEVLIPMGMKAKDVFLSSSAISETGTVAELKEPPRMEGKLRWQIIKILSEGGTEGRKSSSLADRMLESRDSSRPTSNLPPGGGSPDKDMETDSHDQTEIVYKRGVYLVPDASLKDLRNSFVETEQLDRETGLHFQFLNSDVPGDRIDVDTEDEVLLCQIEDRLLQKRTMYIEHIDPGLAMCELCVCGKFADLECTNCHKRGYCSQHCQEKDWSDHEDFCREVSSRRERRRRRKQSRSRSGRRSSSRKATPMSEDTCVCGRPAEYECSGCNKQGYCSEECQREDWSFHEYYCSQPGNSTTTRLSHTPSNMQRGGKLQTLFEYPESSLELEEQ